MSAPEEIIDGMFSGIMDGWHDAMILLRLIWKKE